MLKKEDAVPGTQIVFRDFFKDVIGNDIDYIPITESQGSIMDGCYPIYPSGTATVMEPPRKKDGVNAIKLSIKISIGNVEGYAFWIDVYKNSSVI